MGFDPEVDAGNGDGPPKVKHFTRVGCLIRRATMAMRPSSCTVLEAIRPCIAIFQCDAPATTQPNAQILLGFCPCNVAVPTGVPAGREANVRIGPLLQSHVMDWCYIFFFAKKVICQRSKCAREQTQQQ